MAGRIAMHECGARSRWRWTGPSSRRACTTVSQRRTAASTGPLLRTLPATGDSANGAWELSELGAPYQLDIDTANALLSSAGYDAAAPLTITIDAPPSSGPGGATALHSIQGPIVTSVGEQWQRAFGGSVRVEPLERIWKRESRPRKHVFVSRLELNPDADVLFSQLLPYGVDPDDLVYRLMRCDSVYTGAGINDPEIDEWGIAQRQATDASERSELLEQSSIEGER